ncbi:hypothetical protein GH714_041594 [Hevea brasiliensis]|uniref:Uncharacterized protein n=1 Tax=Hevea brasiliensis TaxID=3981 RepID=A0A6A6MVN0_HEVBR|nr:hypothetical protein GH714_041594 [Hevea brasiliensis]
MVVEKGKKSKLIEKEHSDHIDGELIISVEKLQEIQEELEKHIDEEASDKALEVGQKYNEICRPFYVKQNEIIKAIPDFWLTAFLSHLALYYLLTEENQKGTMNGGNYEKKGNK